MASIQVAGWRRWAGPVVGAVCVAALGSALVGTPPATASSSSFVSAAGGQFLLGGRPTKFVGYNQYRLTSMPGGFVCDGSYGPISDASLAQRLDQMKAAGATVVRSWWFQRFWQQGPAGDQWAAFDRLLSAAAARSMRVIPVLVNQWPDCEWPSIAKNHGFYASAYRSPGYGNSLSFRDWATMVATRYASRPELAWWTLVNEPEAGFVDGNGSYQCPTDAAAVLRAFADDMTGAIKAVDPNHLVSLGTIGEGQCGTSGDEYRFVHAGAVDILEIHDYHHANQPMPGDQYNGAQVRLNQATALGKPIFVGEAGIAADIGPTGSSTGTINRTTLARRAQFFNARMAAQLTAGMDGYLVWESIVEDSASSYNTAGDRYGVGPGDLTGSVVRAWSLRSTQAR